MYNRKLHKIKKQTSKKKRIKQNEIFYENIENIKHYLFQMDKHFIKAIPKYCEYQHF